ncbi:kinase-like domain-containing protein [Annulohypoxylon bovei var. microspora]|nr:kinase-like domain-containing protein [Annulohypoxylon bovei var. microspora]
MASISREEITASVLKTLKGTPYEASSLEALSGGTANFIYRATLTQPLKDGTTDVLVKHSEGYSANSPSFKLTLSRCHVEVGCLKALSDFPIVSKADKSDLYNFTIRTPKFSHFDETSNSQIQEYLHNGINLKNYALKTYVDSNSEATKHQTLQLGKALGRWLRGFHDWAAQQTELRSVVAGNKELQRLKHIINFSWLLDRVKQFPSILGDAEDVFKEVKDMAAAELNDESQLQVIHGDFWSGNILLPQTPIKEGVDVPMFVIDWEMAQLGKLNLDLGQMIAELYELKLYKDIVAGLWIIQGFVGGYGAVSEDFAFRTAIQAGAHLISFGTSVRGWGTQEQVENCARVGKEIIVHAWKKDRRWFEEGDLACLFSRAG